MKKALTVVMVLVMMFTLCAVAMADDAVPAEEAVFTFRNGVTFGMKMDDVISAESSMFYEIDKERTRGPVTFMELEYEKVTENNVRADLSYLFVDDALVAIRVDYETRDISYAQLKAALTAEYGETAQLDRAVLGNGIYAVDDDGRPEYRSEAIVSGNLVIVLELDEDDIDVTYVDLSAPYIGTW